MPKEAVLAPFGQKALRRRVGEYLLRLRRLQKTSHLKPPEKILTLPIAMPQ